MHVRELQANNATYVPPSRGSEEPILLDIRSLLTEFSRVKSGVIFADPSDDFEERDRAASPHARASGTSMPSPARALHSGP